MADLNTHREGATSMTMRELLQVAIPKVPTEGLQGYVTDYEAGRHQPYCYPCAVMSMGAAMFGCDFHVAYQRMRAEAGLLGTGVCAWEAVRDKGGDAHPWAVIETYYEGHWFGVTREVVPPSGERARDIYDECVLELARRAAGVIVWLT